MDLAHEINKAARRLPDGYVLRVEASTSGVDVYVFDIRGRGIDFDDSSDSVAENVFVAVEAAIAWHG